MLRPERYKHLNKNLVKISVKAEVGTTLLDDYNLHQKVRHILDKAMQYFGYDTNRLSEYELVKGTSPLNNDLTLEEAGLVSGDTLILRAKAPLIDG